MEAFEAPQLGAATADPVEQMELAEYLEGHLCATCQHNRVCEIAQAIFRVDVGESVLLTRCGEYLRPRCDDQLDR
jgi:hypothetical protein